ncbi:YhjD/YihY/BrkB family envelope integrity protein, partial [Vibrio parahaemolyticus]|uniref:YhjD/YihY/BrkB family envelope integrity protein n=1 Tax=Vibrio parahaemolyticus TaxID=670 RepID=UPI0021146550
PSCVAFFKYLLKLLTPDRVNVNAGYLAYITLLSIVPMLTVLLSILSKFPVFANVGEVVQGYIIENFVPASGEAVHTA